MIDRRTLGLSGLASLALRPLGVRAQPAGKLHRVVFTTPIGQINDARDGNTWNSLVIAFLEGMRELGYIDGKTMVFEFRSADGKQERVAEIATSVLENPPDVIIAAGGGANEFAQAFKALTRTVPIVLANSSDPVEQGLVASLARPGGNITGFAGNTGPEFEAKRLQLLREIAPDATRLAYLGLKIDWESPAAAGVRKAAERLAVTLLHAEHSPSSYAEAFAHIAREQVQGLFVGRNPWNFSNRRSITEFAAGHGMPAVYPTREYTEAGGLISYGPSLSDLYRRAADHVDKILKGVRPAELPVEQPTKFELVINLQTAKAMGLSIPPTVLTRADEVIE